MTIDNGTIGDSELHAVDRALNHVTDARQQDQEGNANDSGNHGQSDTVERVCVWEWVCQQLQCATWFCGVHCLGLPPHVVLDDGALLELAS